MTELIASSLQGTNRPESRRYNDRQSYSFWQVVGDAWEGLQDGEQS